MMIMIMELVKPMCKSLCPSTYKGIIDHEKKPIYQNK